jgi:hypothetical protein
MASRIGQSALETPNRRAHMTGWQIGTGVVVILCVVALLIAAARRPGQRRKSRGGDAAQVWMTGDPGQGPRDRPDTVGGSDTGKGADSGDSGGDGGGGD